MQARVHMSIASWARILRVDWFYITYRSTVSIHRGVRNTRSNTEQLYVTTAVGNPDSEICLFFNDLRKCRIFVLAQSDIYGKRE